MGAEHIGGAYAAQPQTDSDTAQKFLSSLRDEKLWRDALSRVRFHSLQFRKSTNRFILFQPWKTPPPRYAGRMKALLLLLGMALTARAANRECRVLWIGNSYTAAVWQLVTETATQAGGLPVSSEALAPGAYTWQRHFGDGQSDAVKKIRSGKFDYVILQDQSPAAFRLQNEMKTYGAKFVQEIRTVGAEPVFYCTWTGAAGKQRGPQSTITAAYWELAKEHKALFAPVGPAWEKALTAKPGLKLHMDDGSHPNPAGRYLTMCVFYALLTGMSPVGLPPQLGLPASETKLLQQAAWDAHTEWGRKMRDAGIQLP